MGNAWVVAGTTHRHIMRQPLFFILLISFAGLIYASRYITLFAFNSVSTAGMIREMGISTLTLWGFLVAAIFPVLMITSEMEDRITLTLLSKPIKRGEFLWGRFLGVTRAVFTGLVLLAMVLILTMWHYTGEPSLWSQGKFSEIEYREKIDVWGYIWKYFILADGGIILEGALLSFFQIAVLTAVSVTVSVFMPMVVAITSTSVLFMLGNLAPYLKVSLTKMDVLPLTLLGDGLYYLLPNLSYFNLQSAFSEGRMISPGYLLLSGGYGVMYLSLVLWAGSMMFDRKEIN